MAWWQRRAAPETKASKAGPAVALNRVGQPVWTPRNYEAFAREGYQRNPVVYRSIRRIAEAAASVELKLYNGEDEIETHPLLDLMDRPNPFQDGPSFLEAFHQFLQIAGNSYIERVDRSSTGLPMELWTLRPDRMKLVPDARGYPARYEYTNAGVIVPFDAGGGGSKSQILHQKLFNPTDDWYGLSPLEAAAYDVDLNNKAKALNKALLDNGARPSGALSYKPPHDDSPDKLTDAQFEALKAQLDEQTGTRNSGKPLLLDGGLDWVEMGRSSKDMEQLEGSRESARAIALAFGVPPMLLGIPGDNTYANLKEANVAFWRETVIPLVRKTCTALTHWLLPRYGQETGADGLYLWYDEDAIPALTVETDGLYTRLTNARWLTDDEKREQTGYGPIEGGDKLYGPATEVPRGEELMPVEGGAAPAKPDPAQEDGDPEAAA